MSDATDKMYDNDDLLSLLSEEHPDLSVTVDNGKVEDKSTEDSTSNGDLDAKEIEDKFQKLRELAVSQNVEVVTATTGSGDLDKDLVNWFNGEDKLPSEPLLRYLSNSPNKIEAGVRRTTLSNKSMQNQLKSFLEESIATLFDPSLALSLPPDEFMERYRVAFTCYKELSEFERKVDNDIKTYKLRSNGADSDEMDRMKMMLSTIPADKLKQAVMELQQK